MCAFLDLEGPLTFEIIISENQTAIKALSSINELSYCHIGIEENTKSMYDKFSNRFHVNLNENT